MDSLNVWDPLNISKAGMMLLNLEGKKNALTYWMSTELNWYIIRTPDKLHIFWFDGTFDQPVPSSLFILAVFHPTDIWSVFLWPFLLTHFFIDLELDTLLWWRLVETPHLDKAKSKVRFILLFIIIIIQNTVSNILLLVGFILVYMFSVSICRDKYFVNRLWSFLVLKLAYNYWS